MNFIQKKRPGGYIVVVVVAVVVDSHIQRYVLATEETTVTQQVSHRPIKCRSRLWSQRGTKVNGSHQCDNPLYSDQQGSKSRQKVMRLYKQWHRPMSKRFIKPPYSISRATSIDSECCRLPTTSVLSKKTKTSRSNQLCGECMYTVYFQPEGGVVGVVS